MIFWAFIDAFLSIIWFVEAIKCFQGEAFSPVTCGIISLYFALKFFIEIFKDLLRD